MISGLAAAATALPEREDLLKSAERAVAFIQKYLVDENGGLLRSVYTGDNKEVTQMYAHCLYAHPLVLEQSPYPHSPMITRSLSRRYWIYTKRISTNLFLNGH